jgi:hypothetical protein
METGVEKGSVLDRDRLTQGWREWEHIKREEIEIERRGKGEKERWGTGIDRRELG